MNELSFLDIPCVTWGQILESTSIDERQLRNAIDRGVFPVGKKRANRLLFTIRERFVIDLASALTWNWVPISIAATVALRMRPVFETVQAYWNDVYTKGEHKDGLDLWLAVSRTEDDQIALGLRADASGWLAEGSPIPMTIADLPIQTTVSLVELMKRHLRFCIEHMGDADGDEVSG